MNTPVTGNFLLATPLLDGSWFQDKVIFIAEHNEQNTYGLAVNHSARIPIDEVFSGFKSKERKPFRFFFGGPVQEDMVQVLETGHSQFSDSPEVMPGIWLRALADGEPVPILDLFSEPATRII
ncbi:MAG TPA: YqgE/AlgH family protein, partial [Fibrobacteraceae bacterium]|nr:YqgE/AlgH family protein [Fibrobacteraceae bacterium]